MYKATATAVSEHLLVQAGRGPTTTAGCLALIGRVVASIFNGPRLAEHYFLPTPTSPINCQRLPLAFPYGEFYVCPTSLMHF